MPRHTPSQHPFPAAFEAPRTCETSMPEVEQFVAVDRGDCTSDGSPIRLGLALSGGGFRATLFHLGVVGALYECKVLSCVRVISATSGGSILAAHLVANWKAYLHDKPAFTKLCQEIVDFTRKDIRNHLVAMIPILWLYQALTFPIRWPLLLIGKQKWELRIAHGGTPNRVFRRRIHELTKSWNSRYKWLEDLEALRGEQGNAPALHITTTNMTHGVPAAFTERGLHRDIASTLPPRDASRIRISDAVVASASFPAFFPPHEFLLPEEKLDSKELVRVFLSDGGLCDNLGVGAFLRKETSDQVDLILASDATGRPFKNESIWLRYVIRNLFRTIDVVASTTQSAQQHHSVLLIPDGSLGFANKSKVQYVSIDDRHVYTHAIADDHQELLGAMRTDLDHFTKHEVRSLVAHGYFSTLKRLRAISQELAVAGKPPLVGAAALQNAEQRRFFPVVSKNSNGSLGAAELWWAAWPKTTVDVAKAIDPGKLTGSLERARTRKYWPVIMQPWWLLASLVILSSFAYGAYQLALTAHAYIAAHHP